MARNTPSTSRLRYTPSPGLVPTARDRNLVMQLEDVAVDPDRLACTLRFRNTSTSTLVLRVQRTSMIRSFERWKVLTAEELPVIRDDGAVPLEGTVRLRPGAVAEATYSLPRPRVPAAPWRLFVFFHKNDQALIGTFVFDLSGIAQ